MSNQNYIQGINTERIRWVLDDLHLDADDFGPKVGIKRNFSKRLDAGDLTFIQLQDIAEKLGYGVLFFMEAGLPDIEQVHSIHYRTLANQSVAFDENLSKLVKRMEEHRDIYLNLHEELEEPIADFVPPQLSGTTKEKAQIVRQWLGISSSKSYDFEEYRERILDKGILVFQGTRYPGKWKVKNDIIDGFVINCPKAPIIFIAKESDDANVFKSESQKSFTLFHELAHLLLHKQDKIDNAQTINDELDSKEKEANRFAELCLVPDELIADTYIPDSANNYEQEFKALAGIVGVSVEVIVRRLLNSCKITKEDDQRYVEWCRKNTKKPKEDRENRSYRHREPIHIFGIPYVRAVLSGLAEKHITLNKASDYLDKLSIPDIKKLERHLHG